MTHLRRDGRGRGGPRSRTSARTSTRTSSRASRKVLIAGCGYVGSALARRLVADGGEVWGLKRDPGSLPEGVRPVAADVEDPGGLREALGSARGGLPPELDGAVYAVSAGERSDDGYRRAYVDGPANLLRALEDLGVGVGRFLFVSSTAVYGEGSTDAGTDQKEGADWVDETTPEVPDDFRGERLLEGERRCLAGPFPAVVLRLAGIYGPGRTRLIDSVLRGEAECAEGGPAWTNRIHRDDCAGAIDHLLGLAEPKAVYIGVDDEPADRCEVLRWLARRLGAPEPELVPEGVLPDRRSGTKRCSNRRLVASGYRMIHPSFREGYGAMIGDQPE